MKKILFLSFLFLLLIQCSNKTEVPDKSILVSKYVVFDENISPQLNVCTDDTIVEFKNKGDNCMFKLKDLLFQVEYKVAVHDNGRIQTFEKHTVNNRIDYKEFGIIKDEINPDDLSGNVVWIRFSKDRTKVLDGTDTLKIEQVFPDDKLVFVEKKEKKGRRTIYEYK